MQSKHNTYSSADMDDFSSIFMRSSSIDQLSAMEMLDEEAIRPAMNDIAHERAVSENRNLSNIISQIRDDGSARPKPKKTVRGNSKNTYKKAVTRPVPIEQVQQPKPQPLPVIEEDIEMAAFLKTEENVQTDRRRLWLPFALSLALSVTVVMGFNLYQLNEQSNEMKVALLSYEEQIDELTDNQEESSDALNKVSTLNKDLTDLKQELLVIKSDYETYDTRLAQSMVTGEEPQQQEIASVKQNVSELEENLASTRNEMTAIKAAMDEVKGTMLVKAEPEPVKLESVKSEPVEQAVKTTGWVVNLASVSTMEQAQIGVAQLEKSGIVPGIQEAEVNGAKVYRLFVQGFPTRDEAMLFIALARKQYGFEGGWAWQV